MNFNFQNFICVILFTQLRKVAHVRVRSVEVEAMQSQLDALKSSLYPATP